MNFLLKIMVVALVFPVLLKVASMGKPLWPLRDVAVVMVLLLFYGCDHESTISGEIGDYITLYGYPEDDICHGSASHMDRFVERLSLLLGMDSAEDIRVPVRFVDDVSWCNTTTRIACYSPDDMSVYAEALDSSGYRPMGVLRHEVAHAVIDQAWGRSIPFLEEGLAEATGRASLGITSSVENREILEQVDVDAGSLDYVEAAKFTYCLIDNFGIEKFKNLFQSLERDSRIDEILDGFYAVYGEPLEILEQGYLSGHRGCTYQFDMCDSDPEIFSTRKPSVVVDCSDAQVFGFRDGFLGTQQTFQVAAYEAGEYRLRSTGVISLTRCGRCTDHSQEIFSGFASDANVVLEPGVYTIEVTAQGEANGVVEVDFSGN